MTSAHSVVALDVGGTSIKGWSIDATGTRSAAIEVPTPISDGPEAVVAAVRAAARTLSDDSTVAAGVVVPGVVDSAAGIARYAANLGWRELPLRDLVAGDLGVPVALGHDVTAAGLAERTVGCARSIRDCLVMVIGTGIAGVLVADDRLLRGATGLAGEIGHLPVFPEGERCACGQVGCLETYASAAALIRHYVAAGGRGRPDAREIVAAREQDPIAEEVWRGATYALGIALASATMLLDPAAIVLSGGLAEAGDALLAPVRAALDSRLAWRAAPELLVSPLASRGGRTGAAILAWRAAGVEQFASWTDRVGEPA